MLLIANPRSGRQKGRSVLKKTQKLLRRKGVSFVAKVTGASKHAEELSLMGTRKGFDKIVVIGGDGTINEVAQSLVGTEISMGIIPAGTANDFAETLDIPTNINEAVELICSGNNLKIDVGKVSYSKNKYSTLAEQGSCRRQGSYSKGSKYFVNVFGIGFDAQIVRNVELEEYGQGMLGFILNALKELPVFEEREVPLSWHTSNTPLFMLGITNGKREGKYFQVAPRADLLDGKLDLILIERLSLIKRIECLARAHFGVHEIMPEVHLKKIEELNINVPNDWIAQIDGEPIELIKEIKVEVIPRSLKIISSYCSEYSPEEVKKQLSKKPLGVTF